MATNNNTTRPMIKKSQNNQCSSKQEQTFAYPEKTDDEKIDATARYILERYLPAFKELAK